MTLYQIHYCWLKLFRTHEMMLVSLYLTSFVQNVVIFYKFQSTVMCWKVCCELLVTKILVYLLITNLECVDVVDEINSTCNQYAHVYLPLILLLVEGVFLSVWHVSDTTHWTPILDDTYWTHHSGVREKTHHSGVGVKMFFRIWHGNTARYNYNN